MKINIWPLLLISSSLHAAPNEGFDGKYGIFVWVAMMVLVGIFLYLIRLETKVKRLEKKQNNKDEA